MLAMFPFEAPLYEKARIPVAYVGHPLADAMPLEPDRAEARAQLRLGTATVPVALLPGSRMSELELHADLFIDTAAELHRRRPELRFFVPLATRETREYFEKRLYAKEALEVPIKILFGHAHLALHSAEAAIVASGTATLEAALARCPMVITYRLAPLTYKLVMRKALLPYFGLPNILAGEFIVPELLQEDATPANLAQALGNWLDNKAARDRLRERFGALHASLACRHDERLRQALAPFLTGATDHAAAACDPDHHAAPLRG
jgi:lipid-A-disaccharide synthase